MYLFGYGGGSDGHGSRRHSLTGSRKSSTDDVSKVVDEDETVVEDQDKNSRSFHSYSFSFGGGEKKAET